MRARSTAVGGFSHCHFIQSGITLIHVYIILPGFISLRNKVLELKAFENNNQSSRKHSNLGAKDMNFTTSYNLK